MTEEAEAGAGAGCAFALFLVFFFRLPSAPPDDELVGASRTHRATASARSVRIGYSRPSTTAQRFGAGAGPFDSDTAAVAAMFCCCCCCCCCWTVQLFNC